MAHRPPGFLTADYISRASGAQVFKRGHQYFATNRVTSFDLSPNADAGGPVHATVQGERKYAVTLTAVGDALAHTCDCPMGEQGDFCKHCVAVALAWLNDPALPAPATPPAKPAGPTLSDAARYLATEDKDAIIRTIIDWAKSDPHLHERLLIYATRRADPASAVTAVRKAFQDAVRVRGYISYRETSSWARDVDGAIDLIEQLLNDGQPAEVIGICEAALKSLVTALNHVDDSNGYFSSLSARLHDLHFRACTAAPPDPATLAARLFKLEFTSDYDLFHGAAARYAAILGPAGLSAYRKLAGKEWAKVPARAPGHRNPIGTSYFKITHIMQALARASGDTEELVAVMSRDLSSAWHFLEIATVYSHAGDPTKALAWAERGLAAFPTHTDWRLRAFLAVEYRALGRNTDSMNLVWAEFSDKMTLENWKLLEASSNLIPADDTANSWPAWRKRALEYIRTRIAQSKHMDHSLLVEIYLHERRPDDAWREAEIGGCFDSLWLRLAALRAATHPAEAAAIYFRQATILLARIRDGRYEETVAHLCKAAELMRRIGRGADFGNQLAVLRTEYKAKRNFTKLLDEKRQMLLG